MTKHILIINQHGENRGDEAAMRAMLNSFQRELDCNVKFTLLYQFRDRELRLDFKEQVEDLPIILPVIDYLRLLAFTVFKYIKLDAKFLLSPTLRSIIRAYEETDLVVSAPGGPYFGDIYANHELLHWWFVLLGHLFSKPIFLYATSAGPFKLRAMNVVRKWLFPKFTKLVTREAISAGHLKELLGNEIEVSITADSAIQQIFEPYSREVFFKGRSESLASKILVAVVLNDYHYPGSKNPQMHKKKFEQEIVAVMQHLVNEHSAHIIFLPQLYGKAHNDAVFMKRLASELPLHSWEMINQQLNSDLQREIVAMCDIHLACRYHPAIFGNTGYVPGVCVYYEHKALGFMQQLGLDHLAFDIREIKREQIIRALDDVILSRFELVKHLKERVPKIQQLAQRTTKLATEIIAAK